MQDRFAATDFGRLHYLHGGSGPALILMHSNGGSAHDFETVFDRLAQSFEVYSVDIPGQGDSDPLTRHLSVRDYADALISFMDSVGIAKASVLGVSIGGAVCVSVGAHYAERLEALYIVECPARSEEEWAKQWPRIEANFSQPVQKYEDVAPRMRSVSDAFLKRWNIDRQKAGAKAMMSVMWALREYDAQADLPHVAPGAMVIFGDTGPTIAGKEAFVAPLADARTVVMSNCGHFPNFDDPDAFCDLIETHFKSRSQGSETLQ